jgi:hypothetical protein
MHPLLSPHPAGLPAPRGALARLALLAACAACAPPPPHPAPVPAAPAAAADDAWRRLIAESDSVGPETPLAVPGPRTPCTAGVEIADSVRVTGGSGEFLLGRLSLRTRGNFTYPDPPRAGAARFAIRAVYCDREHGHPYTFVLERDHRYFYLVYSLRRHPTYAGLSFRTEAGAWRAFRWDPDGRTFSATGER